jgi:acyl carrier protein
MDVALAEKITQRRKVLDTIKQELVDRLELDVETQYIDDDTFLFGGGLGLDSIDAMEIIIGMQARFSVVIPEDGIAMLRTVNTLADFILADQEA